MTLAAGRRGMLVLCFAGASLACREPEGPIDEETYVHVMARLSYAQARFLDVASIDSARRAILEETGIDPVDLLAFAELHGADTGRMTVLHDRIRLAVDSLDAVERGMGTGGDTLPAEPPR